MGNIDVNGDADGSVLRELSYKEQQERWVAGLTGTSTWEVQLLVTIGLSGHFLLKVLSRSTSYSKWKKWQQLLLDYAVLVLPCIVAFTAAELALFLVVAQCSLAFIFAHLKGIKFNFWVSSNHTLTKEDRATLASFAQPKKPFMSVYRALMMVSTCVCILAVDFPIFPRRFAKTEMFGTSLMDAGVGSFVLANSLTVKNALQKTSIFQSIKSAIPVGLLGLARFITVKSVDYQEHVSEYGIHWNFFFTLAFLPLFGVVVKIFLGLNNVTLAACAVAFAYQCVLSMGLDQYILTAPRVDLISMNKEGLFSLIGYTSIFLFGIDLGTYLLRQKPIHQWYYLIAIIFSVDGILWLAIYLLQLFGWEISRGMVNLPYIIWIFAYNLPLIGGFLYIDLIVGYTHPIALYEAINRNQLAIFLLANIMTGLVNMSMQTIYASTFVSYVVLIIYSFAFSAVAVFFDYMNWTLKFW